jgi:hypothetical protein
MKLCNAYRRSFYLLGEYFQRYAAKHRYFKTKVIHAHTVGLITHIMLKAN